MDKNLQNIKNLVNERRFGDARHQLLLVDKSSLKREEKLEFSELARRAGLSSISVRTLHPLVREQKEGGASAEETAEYAMALAEMGLYREAEQLLKGLSRSPLPQFYLAKTFAYQRNFKEVQNILGWLGQSDKLPKEEAIAFQLLSFWSRVEESPNERSSVLLEWENFVKRHPFVDNLGVRKWKAVARLFENPANVRTLEEIKTIRNEAVEKGFWEDVRDCDRIEAIVTKNEKLLCHVYFGTPFQAFREKLLKEYRLPISMPKFYDWSVQFDSLQKDIKPKWTFDLLMGERIGGKTPIKVGKGMHRLLSILASDFYKPVGIPQLFSSLYPDEHYDPTTSSPRVHQILNRLRIWFKKSHFPLSVQEKEHCYRLNSEEGCILRIPTLDALSDPSLIHLAKLKEIYPDQAFSAIEAGKALGVSGRTILRLMDKGTKAQMVTRSGKGAATRYQFISVKETAKKAA